jgi:hypothetical protein
VAGPLAAPVQDEYRAVALAVPDRGGQRGRGGMGDVMGYEPDLLRVQPVERLGEEEWRP